jgi:hypothetical protein
MIAVLQNYLRDILRGEMDLLDRLRASIVVLSLPYQLQKNEYPSFVDVPFEVIDDFEKQILLLPAIIDSGVLSHYCVASIVRIHNLIGMVARMPGYENLDESQFEADEEWEKVRILASETLVLFPGE